MSTRMNLSLVTLAAVAAAAFAVPDVVTAGNVGPAQFILAQDAPPTQTSTASSSIILDGCAGDAAQFCSGATGAAAIGQCIAAQDPTTLSDACTAALAQDPPPGVPQHLGGDPVPAANAATANNQPLPFAPPYIPPNTAGN